MDIGASIPTPVVFLSMIILPSKEKHIIPDAQRLKTESLPVQIISDTERLEGRVCQSICNIK